MSNVDYRQSVEQEVARRIQAHEMFTAWDITRAVRAQGVNQQHHVLKEVVHNLYSDGCMGLNYERTLVDVGDNGTQAFLYHHFEDDPADYGSQAHDNRYDLGTLVPPAKQSFLDRLLHLARNPDT